MELLQSIGKIAILIAVISVPLIVFFKKAADVINEDNSIDDVQLLINRYEGYGPKYKLNGATVYFDLENKRMLVVNDDRRCLSIPSSYITNVFAIERVNTTSHQGHAISRAIVGDIIAGGAGAIVGAASANKGSSLYIRKLAYRISIADEENDYTIYLNIAECIDNPSIIKYRYERFDEIGDILRFNFGLTIQHVD